MKKVFSCESSKKADVEKILKDDPYGMPSFSRQGYDFKDGKAYEMEKKWVLCLNCDEEFLEWAKEKLGELVEELSEEKAKEVSGKIEDEKNQAASSFGDIFG